ncbi:hypothetical protein QFZ75_006815 [Streptomyces sp. V3I8]|uniref:hypothetical protein n=1 Tax=Streptomyces sp. V3I8 TaxID=3042279 RepID=UPI00278386F2|nr:hypothetical protein [Streptomyces sp. V3I8]MDQ1040399.1 hypothetical protein [Streptomyces sp. V3I8]
MLLLLLAVIVGLGAVAAAVLMVTGRDGSSGGKSPERRGSGTERSPSPSPSIPSQLPSELPSLPSGGPSELPSGLESLLPSRASDEVPYYMLRTGDCFDADEGRPGRAVKRPCTGKHDAEVVKVAELEGAYTTDAALEKAASDLCQEFLDTKAAEQPAGTVRGTLVQYPDPAGFGVGIDNVACSLAADIGEGNRKLTGPLK